MKSTISIQHFWAWFGRHSEDYQYLLEMSKEDFDYFIIELEAHLQACGQLSCFTIVSNPESVSELIFSSDHQPDRFDDIDAFVAAAPSVPNWKFTALLPPRKPDFDLEELLADKNVNPDQLYCSLIDIGPDDPVYIVIHSDDFEFGKDPDLEILLLNIVFNLLGERMFYEELACVGCDRMHGMTESDLVKLTDIRTHFLRRASDMHVDEQGRIHDDVIRRSAG